MRFYAQPRTMMWLTTAVWSFIFADRAQRMLYRHDHGAMTIILAACSAFLVIAQWLIYWEITPDALILHRTVQRTVIPFQQISCITRVRNRSTSYLQIQRTTGKPLPLHVHDEPAFLEDLEQRLPAGVLQA